MTREERIFQTMKWALPLILLTVGIAVLLSGCGGRGGFAGPSAVPAPSAGSSSPPIATQLPVPAFLYGYFAAGRDVTAAVAGPENFVVILPSYAEDDPMAIARTLRSKGAGTYVYAGHIFEADLSTWDAAWPAFDRYLQPFRQEGVLWGVMPLDEVVERGIGARLVPAIAYLHGRGIAVMTSETKNGVYLLGARRPPVDLWAVDCYDFGDRWNADTCGRNLYDQHPEIDIVIGQGWDPGTGWQDPAEWIRTARPHRGIAWWSYEDSAAGGQVARQRAAWSAQ